MRGLLLIAALLGAAGLSAALPLPGSDAYGYSAAVQASSWTEISGTGTPVTAWAGGADDGSALINIPFNFRFYGAPYNKVSVSSNGYLQFGSQSSFYGVNCLGANLDPRNVAALYWMDLNPGAGGAVYTEVQGSPGSRVFIVQFQAVPPSVGGGSVTAQWRLYEADNSLEATWASTASTGSGADAVAGLRSGFDCANRTSFPLSCQQGLLTDGLSVRFNYPGVEPACGTPTITQSFTQSATFSVSPTFSPSPSITPTFTASPTWTDTPSVSPSFSVSPTLAETATPTASSTVSPSPSASRTPQVLSDAFGYVALQAPLAWDEISGTGAPITAWAGGPDDGSALVDLPGGWLFRFYGADYTKVAVSSNGYLQFGSASAAFGNSCLNAGASPFGLAALFWSDLDLDLGGTVYWQVLGSAPNRRLVIQFQAVPNQGATGTLTAQAALFEGSHAISLRYLSTASLGNGAAAAAGLRSFFECPNRTGLSLSCNQAQLPTGTQWDMSYPLVEPACGTPTFTATPSSSATQTPSASPSSTESPSASPSHSPTESPSATLSPTPSHSPTQTQTWSITPTHSVSPTITQTGTISPTHTDSPTVTDTPSITQTGTISPTFSESPTATPSPTESPSFTESPTATETPSITETLSNTATFSESPTASESWTASATPSDSPTQSPSFTATPSFSFSPTRSATPTATPTGTPTDTGTATPSATRTATRTASSTRTVSPTPTSTLFPPATKPGCLVLGQGSFLSGVSGSASMNLPAGIALDTRGTPFKVYVADSANHRILFWNDAAALSNGLPPEGVIGQADFTGVSANRGLSPAADRLSAPTGLAVDPNNGDLWVADSGNHRVLRFSAPVALSGAAASRVLGQGGSFSSAVASLGGVSAQSLNTPSGLSMDSFGRLAVADTLHHRVLRFSDPGNNATADAAWGQTLSLTQGLPNQGGAPSADSLLSPQGVHLGVNEVWIADSGNHRVLRFGTAPFLTGTADRVLGQTDFSASSPNQGFGSTNETRLHTPRGLSWDGGGRLIVSDSGNHRLVAFEPPFDNFAEQYYGQNNIGSRSPGTNQDRLQGPSAAFAWGGLLAVADTDNHRVLFYGCGAGVGVATPTPTRSATPTHSPTSTATPTTTPTSSITPSFSPSPSFTASETRTPSATVSVSFTRSSTPSITQTRTVTPTETPVATATVTLTVPPTLTPYPRSDGRILAWPNPAPRDGGRACIGFVPAADVRIEIYDRLAQPVVSLSGAQINAAGGFACWDLRNREGTLLAPGWYYVRVLSDGQAKLGKLTVR